MSASWLSSRSRRVLVATMVLVTLASCGDADDITSTGGSQSDPAVAAAVVEPPADLTTHGIAAAASDGSVVVVEAYNERGDVAGSALLWRRDHTWEQLPDPPQLLSADVVTVGDSVALVGVQCPKGAEDCNEGKLYGVLLSPDHAQWDPIAFPTVAYAIDSASVNGLGSTADQGFVRFDNDLFALNGDGTASLLPSVPGMWSHVCVTANRLVATFLEHEPVDEQIQQVAEQYVSLPLLGMAELSPTSSEAAWKPLAIASDNADVGGQLFCGPEGPIVLFEGVEFAFSSDGKWIERPTDLPSGTFGKTVLGGDGSVVVPFPDDDPTTLGVDDLYLRTADGAWERIEAAANSTVPITGFDGGAGREGIPLLVVGTSESVLMATDTEGGFVEVSP